MNTAISKIRLSISGIVQGVGFRPFVYNLAIRHSLFGYVRNQLGSVEVEATGCRYALELFIEQLQEQAPPLSEIKSLKIKWLDVEANVEEDFARQPIFEILPSFDQMLSSRNIEQHYFVPPDMATCNLCLSELFNDKNRRFRYPFINCTNCGPRFTIIDSLPYDRQNTTMKSFKMCAECQNEYDDFSDRRFHAQPNACAKCGPQLSFIRKDGDGFFSVKGQDSLELVLEELKNGKIVGVKSLGGFHLICDAFQESAIRKIRSRKSRPHKPLAVMMANIEMVRQHCLVSAVEEQALQEVRRPIVLLKRLDGCTLSDNLAPGIESLGVMLPYTPLHSLILNDYGKPVVATSGNKIDEPIAISDEEAILNLESIADAFLSHDRRIYSRYDDSVLRFNDDKQLILRRARGYAPSPIELPTKANLNVLAFGGHLKNTFCLVKNENAFVSQHIGDLENIETQEHFRSTYQVYKKLLNFEPQLIAYDKHPDYLSSKLAQQYAQENNLPAMAVQHHHAHIVSCMVENNITEPVIGVSFDGIGYGDDGKLWGGEFLLSTYSDYQRVGHFKEVPLAGGMQAIKEPWRMALSYIVASSRSDNYRRFIDEITDKFGQKTIDLIKQQIERQINCPFTSSCGRLFDAMSALLNICWQASYEGQAAIELEAVAKSASGSIECNRENIYEFLVSDGDMMVVDPARILDQAFLDYCNGVQKNVIATKFHYTIVYATLYVCSEIRKRTGINVICFGGGVFQNTLLMHYLENVLSQASFKVLFPRQLPANDGGLSLGQAMVALAKVDALSYDERQRVVLDNTRMDLCV